ncbi:MAG: hypothetical protein ACRDZ2_11030 [Ilumatobacteraceae bacterium]
MPLASRSAGDAGVADVTQPVTDDSIRVRHLSHYQFSWIAQEPGEDGVWTLQLVLDQGAWEEVLTLDADDADVLQELLRHGTDVTYDVGRRVLMFGTTAVGH